MTTTGLTFTADVSVDAETLDFDELEYDYTRIDTSGFGFTATVVLKVPRQKALRYIDVEITAGGLSD